MTSFLGDQNADVRGVGGGIFMIITPWTAFFGIRDSFFYENSYKVTQPVVVVLH